jgi:proteasome assembly chaperone 3
MGQPLQRKSTIRSGANGEIITNIVCTSYVDRHLVVITQMKKFGTIIHAWSESKADGGKYYDMVTLLGRRDDPLLSVYARQIIEKIAAFSDKPLVLAIGLTADGRDTETFQGILNEIVSRTSTWSPVEA